MVNTKLIMWVMASDYSARTWGHKPNGWPPLVGDLLLLFFVCWVEWFWGRSYVKRAPPKKMAIITSYYFIPQVMTLG